MKDLTIQVHGGYETEKTTHAVFPPIYQTVAYEFDSAQHAADLFNLEVPGNIYTRLMNPTCDVLEKRIAMLEKGVAAICLASGQAAISYALINLVRAGDNVVTVPQLYGGTFTLINSMLPDMGVEGRFAKDDSPEAIEALIDEKTRCVYCETIGNPAGNIVDIEALAEVAHRHGVPLIVDNTVASPALCKPIEFGADIVVHSMTKFIAGHGNTMGGVIVDSGNFEWENGNFPELVEPDESYHGISYVKSYGKSAYITKARMQLMRDFGCYPAAHSSFLLNLGLETLAVRMKQYCENALKVAKYFESSDKVESVIYPGLESDKNYALAKKYLSGCSGVISFVIKGGRPNAIKFMDSLKLASNEVHVADIRTCVLHPASETHRQLTEEQLVLAGINGGMIRFSCGLENVDDIIADIEQAFSKVN